MSQSTGHAIFARREFFRRTGLTFGSLAAASLLGQLATPAGLFADGGGLTPRTPPLPAKAKAIIHIFAAGAPSHLDTFDPKPALEKYADKTLPGQGGGVGFPSPFTFTPSGKSGLLMSSAFPKLAGVADELCVLRSMTIDVPAHGPAAKMMHTGSLIQAKPSVGSWTLFGLGSNNRSLPGFITLGGSAEWRQAAFLPSMYQGTRADFAANKPVDRVLSNLRNDFSMPDTQRKQLVGPQTDPPQGCNAPTAFFVSDVWPKYFATYSCGQSNCHDAQSGRGYFRLMDVSAVTAPNPMAPLSAWPFEWQQNIRNVQQNLSCSDPTNSLVLAVPSGRSIPHPPGVTVTNIPSADALFTMWLQ